MARTPVSNQPGEEEVMVVKATSDPAIPLFDGKDYDVWSVRIETKLFAHQMLDIVQGTHRREDCHTPEQVRCFETKTGKTQLILVGALSSRIVRQFCPIIRNGDPRALWIALRDAFGDSETINPILLIQKMMTRVLLPTETIVSYLDDLMSMQDKLLRMDYGLEERVLALLMLTNAITRFPDMEHELAKCLMSDGPPTVPMA